MFSPKPSAFFIKAHKEEKGIIILLWLDTYIRIVQWLRVVTKNNDEMLLGENCIFIAVQSSFTELLIESYIFPTSTANLNIKIEEIKHKPRPKNTI